MPDSEFKQLPIDLKKNQQDIRWAAFALHAALVRLKLSGGALSPVQERMRINADAFLQEDECQRKP